MSVGERFLVCGGVAVGSTYALMMFVPRMFDGPRTGSMIWCATTFALMMGWEKIRKSDPPLARCRGIIAWHRASGGRQRAANRAS
jgi:hypothetical protein